MYMPYLGWLSVVLCTVWGMKPMNFCTSNCDVKDDLQCNLVSKELKYHSEYTRGNTALGYSQVASIVYGKAE